MLDSSTETTVVKGLVTVLAFIAISWYMAVYSLSLFCSKQSLQQIIQLLLFFPTVIV